MSEAHLYQAVIRQAIDDATVNAPCGVDGSRRDRVRREARDWLTKPSAWFDQVCSMADLDPDVVRHYAAEAIAKGNPAPKPYAKGASITFDGETLSLEQWAKRVGIGFPALQRRLVEGWPLEDALKLGNSKGRPRKAAGPGGGVATSAGIGGPVGAPKFTVGPNWSFAMTIVSLDEAKAHLNIVGDEDDALILAKIEAAQSYIAAYVDCPMTPEDAPPLVKEAVKMVVATLYECRESSLVGPALDVQAAPIGPLELVGRYRRWVF